MNEDRFPAVLSAAAHGRVLVDNAAGAQLPDRCLERLQRYLTYDNAQRGSVFARTEATNALVEEAKRECADLIARPSNASERASLEFIDAGVRLRALDRGLDSLRRPRRRHRGGPRSKRRTLDVAAPFLIQVHVVPVDRHGDLDEEKYRLLLASEPVLVALPWASNATGTVFDVASLSRAAKAAGATVVVDGVQAFPHFPLEIPRSVDFVFLAYKCYAPHLAFWYLSEGAFERFVRADDEQCAGAVVCYRTLETGTQSYEALAGWLGTVEYLRDIAPEPRRALAAIARYEAELSEYTRRAFAERTERVTLYGRPASDGRLPVFAFNVAGVAGEEVARRLEAAGIEARFVHHAPRLMRALAPDYRGQALRISLAHYNTREDVERCFAVIDAVAG